MSDLNDDITRASLRLMIREPFFGHLCAMMHKTFDTAVERIELSLSLTAGYQLRINPNYWRQLNAEDLKSGIVKHQLLHLAFKHPFRKQQFGNQQNFDIAADLVVNQFLLPEQRTPDAITIAQFGYPSNCTVDAYYRMLDQTSQLPFLTNNSSGNGGSLVDHMPEKMEARKEPLDEHAKWKSDSDAPSVQLLLEESLDQMISTSYERLGAKDAGLLPAGIVEQIREVLQRNSPVLNWKRMFRMFAASARKTYLKSTIKKPSKRYGTIPGIRIRNRQKLLVAIDTSGSVSQKDLTEFFNEIYHIWKTGVDVQIVECDAAIHKIYPYRGKTPEKISGRGGTDFTPPIVYANEHYRPDAIIYFSDGHAHAPAVPSRAPVFWVISSGGIKENQWDFLPGRKVKM